jgi:outer membrane beta-barrel protein
MTAMTKLAIALAAVLLPAAARAQAFGEGDADVQRVHVVEKRPFAEAGRTELSLFAPVQVNSRFTMHAGVSAELSYHLRENLAVQGSVTWFPLAVQSGLSEELAAKANQEPVAANALLLQGDAVVGLEVMPIYGKLSVFDGRILRLGFYLDAGVGVAKTRLQLRPSTSVDGRAFADAGFRPAGALGAGFRVFVGDRVTVRLEMRDRLYSAYVDRVNGCTAADAAQIRDSGAAAAGLSAGCSPGSFGGNDAQMKGSAATAAVLLAQPSAGVINNLAFQGGVSWLF